MKLPNAHLAVVEQGKILGYLLDRQHQYGASKAHFFLRFGFTLEAWEVLAAAFCEHGLRHEVTVVTETPFGPRYEVEGLLRIRMGATRPPAPSGSWTKDSLHRG
jgi:hypothetical protein